MVKPLLHPHPSCTVASTSPYRGRCRTLAMIRRELYLKDARMVPWDSTGRSDCERLHDDQTHHRPLPFKHCVQVPLHDDLLGESTRRSSRSKPPPCKHIRENGASSDDEDNSKRCQLMSLLMSTCRRRESCDRCCNPMCSCTMRSVSTSRTHGGRGCRSGQLRIFFIDNTPGKSQLQAPAIIAQEGAEIG